MTRNDRTPDEWKELVDAATESSFRTAELRD